ncbi:hypothetical protein J1N35_028225 [Gossypium stocksii]|uniref:Uncharacterized protein n=1 Tax=Gossypium stocksii TaxID=47602 RepID=A0A9D3UVU1_9ROSI|nr:hypothetical protein J1N35_028225 [Gossypium stocksii]
MLGELNEGDTNAVSVGITAEVDLGVSRLNSDMDRACEDVANMVKVGVKMGWQILKKDWISPDENINTEIPKTEDRGISQEIEEEFYNTIRSRRKKKQFNKRIRSMRVIQDGLLSSKKIQRRDRSRRNDKSSAVPGSEDKVVNLSLSDSNISNRRKIILRKAKQT